ncbi:hypothetical protein AJ78_06203 [Emergomyces pasteurianus Ep9510]|uniref:Uncharacterized protein n=1 Tax=Emergomyces pasteurianus Ep9510 TaxID=1447872 RepID=A0A1J9P9U7_9EURO|nr:hypothetical protein AJ78_06203 [Emergomyces pasteurianus Ep9510]
MLIAKGDPERGIWIDFDRAYTYDEHSITDRERILLDEEEETVEGIKICLEADLPEGRLNQAYIFYCT